MFKRPSDDDDDDEKMLRQQAEFFKQKAEKKVFPAAKLIRSEEVSSTTQSLNQKLLPNDDTVSEVNNETSVQTIQEQIANTFEAIPTDMKLNQIFERHATSTQVPALKFDRGGFPRAVRRDLEVKPKKGSIFSEHIKRLKRETVNNANAVYKMQVDEIALVVKENDVDGNITTHTEGNIHCTEGIGTNAQRFKISATDRQLIHKENMTTLNNMSKKELHTERQKLLTTLDPALIQFLKSRSSSNAEPQENRNPTIKEQNKPAETVNIDQLEVPKEVLSTAGANGWLHFNQFEANKLAWMKDICVSELKKTEGFEARFDFDGYLLPYSMSQIDEKNRHLYHHGQEPERPGYSLQELLLLSRSQILQQRVVALNVIGNILSLDQTGIYDKVLDIPIEQVFFVVRMCMDDNTPSVLTTAIKALRNLVYFQIDETCLDNLMSFGIGMIQPSLAVDHNLEDDTINDQQLAETNLIKCLARTNILTRLRYIINTVKPSSETIIYCIEILIRLSRDSESIINKLLECENLLSSLVKYFMPTPNVMALEKTCPGYNIPLPQIIKLLRVISSRTRHLAVSLLKKYDILNLVLAYLYEDYFSQNAVGMRLQVECMYYWTLLLHYGLELDSVRQHKNLLFKFLDYHFKNSDNVVSTTLIRQSHLSALLILLAKVEEKIPNIFVNEMRYCFLKWTSQFKLFEDFKCSKSQITSALLYYASTCNRIGSSVYNKQFLESLIASKGFELATSKVINGSLLLNHYETHKTTTNLKSLEAASWFSMDHIVPVLQSNSCIPFLYALSCGVLTDCLAETKVAFLQHYHIQEYIRRLETAKHYYNVGNWFTRCESFLIMNILKIAQIVRNNIDPNMYYCIAVKALSIFTADQKEDMQYLLNNIVFCPRFYPVEVAMANAKISERNNELDKAWTHLNNIKNVYSDVLGVNSNMHKFVTTLTLDTSIGNVIPMDWIYTPLVLLYSNQQKRSKNDVIDESQDFHLMLNCLRWILICETYFENLTQSISPTEKYVRLGCLFLGSDNLFLHEEIQKLLVLIYQFLAKNEEKINFEQEIAGLTNFKDFFVQLLEQYQAVSYGNAVFGNVLLFPLMKRHDIKYRKTLWSEYMGVVETFTVKSKEVWINKDNLIYPVDTDTSLCTSYHKALATKSVPSNTIMHEIVTVNVRYFKERLEKGKNT